MISSISDLPQISAGLKQSVLLNPGNDRLVMPMITALFCIQSATTAAATMGALEVDNDTLLQLIFDANAN